MLKFLWLLLHCSEQNHTLCWLIKQCVLEQRCISYALLSLTVVKTWCLSSHSNRRFTQVMSSMKRQVAELKFSHKNIFGTWLVVKVNWSSSPLFGLSRITQLLCFSQQPRKINSEQRMKQQKKTGKSNIWPTAVCTSSYLSVWPKTGAITQNVALFLDWMVWIKLQITITKSKANEGEF